MISFNPRPLYLRGYSTRCPLKRRLGRLLSRSSRFGEEIDLSPLTRIELRFLSFTVSRLSTAKCVQTVFMSVFKVLSTTIRMCIGFRSWPVDCYVIYLFIFLVWGLLSLEFRSVKGLLLMRRWETDEYWTLIKQELTDGNTWAGSKNIPVLLSPLKIKQGFPGIEIGSRHWELVNGVTRTIWLLFTCSRNFRF